MRRKTPMSRQTPTPRLPIALRAHHHHQHRLLTITTIPTTPCRSHLPQRTRTRPRRSRAVRALLAAYTDVAIAGGMGAYATTQAPASTDSAPLYRSPQPKRPKRPHVHQPSTQTTTSTRHFTHKLRTSQQLLPLPSPTLHRSTRPTPLTLRHLIKSPLYLSPSPRRLLPQTTLPRTPRAFRHMRPRHLHLTPSPRLQSTLHNTHNLYFSNTSAPT